MPRRAQRGYALVLTLFLLALASIVAARLADRLSGLRTEGAFWQDYADAFPQLASARAEALYAITTRPASAAGFGPLGDTANLVVPDGRPYRASSGALVQFVDSRSTLSLNTPDRTLLGSLLVARGISPQRADRMLDILEDYIDTDNLKRLNGAEEAEYRALGLPPPRNDWLLAFDELKRMPEWRDDPASLASLEPVLSVRRTAFLNPNILGPDLLRLLPGATPERLALFLERRQLGLFTSAADAVRQTGWPFDSETMIFYPSDQLSIKISTPKSPYGKTTNLLFTPTGDHPWIMLEARTTRRAPQADTARADAPPPLPVTYTGAPWSPDL